MSLHNYQGLSLLGAGFEAIYQIAKKRVLDRYWGIEGIKCVNGGELHAWHFDRPQAVQDEIYQECHQVAGEIGANFDTDGYIALCRLSTFKDASQTNKVLYLRDSLYRQFACFNEVCDDQKLRDRAWKLANRPSKLKTLTAPTLPKRSPKKKGAK